MLSKLYIDIYFSIMDPMELSQSHLQSQPSEEQSNAALAVVSDPVEEGGTLAVDHTAIPTKAIVLPLFATLSADQQRRVFEPTPPNVRVIVVATNVAETSITIPGIKYVVDCGRYKEKTIQSASGISKYEVITCKDFLFFGKLIYESPCLLRALA